METIYRLERFIGRELEGSYFTYHFEMPPDSETLTLTYTYARHTRGELDPGGLDNPFTRREEINIIDLGLIDPDGRQVGVSGSDKTEVSVSETRATPGYRPTPLIPGEWQILVGAYKVASEGVTVVYEVRIVEKSPRWLKGDLHAHTLASDGVHTAEELAWKAKRGGLDFLAITDHNQMVAAGELPRVEGVTLIPGVEWTHYRGHANFLGVDAPYDGPFAANTEDEIRQRFTSARERGALITANHPFEQNYGFSFDLEALPIDCFEVWNGPMREANLRALWTWQSLLAAGKKLPICGGSDYHHDTPFTFLGGPTTWVYAQSAGASDILAALRAGHSYVSYAPDGPTLEMNAGEKGMGDTVNLSAVKVVRLVVDRLVKGDMVRLVTGHDEVELLEATGPGRFETVYEMDAPGFARVEVLRGFIPGIPKLPALISNPIYFE